KSAPRTRAANTVLAIREMAQRHGFLDKVTITSWPMRG
ncbi:glycerophosphoryl diester phosphodiesterase, partial [Pseudomonas amygdali pv. mori str. 301020]